jgi:Uncharacterized conserved protein
MEHSLTQYVDIIGLMAGTLTTLSFMPQVIKTWKSRSAKDVSLVMLIMFALGVSLWIAYGYATRATPVICANFATLALIIVLLILKFKYRQEK